jgi:hypothetical protein
MLRRTVEQASSTMDYREATEASETASSAATDRTASAITEFLPPWRSLNGFGALVAADPAAKSVAAADFDKALATPETPPGYYGPSGRVRALNVVASQWRPAALAMAGSAQQSNYAQQAAAPLAPWLFLGALAIFAIDAILTLIMTMAGGLRAAGRAAAAVIAALALIAAVPSGVRADPARPKAEEPVSQATIDAALNTRLAYVITGDDSVDAVSRSGLRGLSRILATRTAIEPAEPMGVDPGRDELSVFPLLYWPVLPDAEPLTDAVAAKIDAYMKGGGMIIFDTRDYAQMSSRGPGGAVETPLGALLSKLDLPRLEPANDEHVVTKSFYILRGFPGRWDGGQLWVEAQTNVSGAETRRAVKSDGVSSIIVTSNDFAAAWALDEKDRPLFPIVPGGEEQREMAYRAGVNIVMYALTGNYKADQVHVPALLERLGH